MEIAGHGTRPHQDPPCPMGTTSKALSLLGCFTRARPQVGLSDLARLAGVNKATCFRLMSELCDHGLAEQVGLSREYRIGPGVLRLAALREASVPMRDAAMPVVQTLADATGETAHVSVMIGEKLAMLGFAYSPVHATRVMMDDTDTLPFHATSSGLAVLAFAPDAVRDRVLAGPLSVLTDRTETDPDRLRERLAAIRRTGMSESEGGLEADVNSVAVPLFDAQGRCAGALAVAAPAQRLGTPERALIRDRIVSAGRRITNLWGGSLPAVVEAAWADAA